MDRNKIFNLIVLLILVITLPLGIWLAQQYQIFGAHASSDPIELSGTNVIKDSSGKWKVRPSVNPSTNKLEWKANIVLNAPVEPVPINSPISDIGSKNSLSKLFQMPELIKTAHAREPDGGENDPTNINAHCSNTDCSEVTVSWDPDPASNSRSYLIRISPGDSSKYLWTSFNSVIFKSLSQNTAYNFSVERYRFGYGDVGYNKDRQSYVYNSSPHSGRPSVDITTTGSGGGDEAAPENVNASCANTNCTSVKLQWDGDSVSQPRSYLVRFLNDRSKDVWTFDPTVTFNGLNPNTQYDFTITRYLYGYWDVATNQNVKKYVFDTSPHSEQSSAGIKTTPSTGGGGGVIPAIQPSCNITATPGDGTLNVTYNGFGTLDGTTRLWIAKSGTKDAFTMSPAVLREYQSTREYEVDNCALAANVGTCTNSSGRSSFTLPAGNYDLWCDVLKNVGGLVCSGKDSATIAKCPGTSSLASVGVTTPPAVCDVSACGSSQKCNAANNACEEISCAAPANTCTQNTAVNHACTVSNKADGTACTTSSQSAGTCTAGDCTATTPPPTCPAGSNPCTLSRSCNNGAGQQAITGCSDGTSCKEVTSSACVDAKCACVQTINDTRLNCSVDNTKISTGGTLNWSAAYSADKFPTDAKVIWSGAVNDPIVGKTGLNPAVTYTSTSPASYKPEFYLTWGETASSINKSQSITSCPTVSVIPGVAPSRAISATLALNPAQVKIGSSVSFSGTANFLDKNSTDNLASAQVLVYSLDDNNALSASPVMSSGIINLNPSADKTANFKFDVLRDLWKPSAEGNYLALLKITSTSGITCSYNGTNSCGDSSYSPVQISDSNLSGTLEGPESTKTNTEITFNASVSDSASKLSSAQIFVEKTNPSANEKVADWCGTGTVATDRCLLGGKTSASLSRKSNVTFEQKWTPTKPGEYIVYLEIKNTANIKCSGTAKQTTNSCGDGSIIDLKIDLTQATNGYRFSEDLTAIKTASFIDYKESPTTFEYLFKGKDENTPPVPGTRTIFVDYRLNTDTSATKYDQSRRSIQVELLAPDPVIDPGVSCKLDLSGKGLAVTFLGRNFGSQKTGMVVKLNDQVATVTDATDTKVLASLKNPVVDVDNGQTYNVSLTRADGQSVSTTCNVGVSQLSVGAKLFCRAPNSFDLSSVEMTLADTFTGGKLIKKTVSIDKNGVVQGMTNLLQNGACYRMSLKAPNTTRKTFVFQATEGTTVVNDLNLQIGDIYPVGGDGQINASDRSELIRQWSAGGTASSSVQGATTKTGDFNQDGAINAYDYSCQFLNYNAGDNAPAAVGPLTAAEKDKCQSTVDVTPNPSPSVEPSPSGSASTTTSTTEVTSGAKLVFPYCDSNGKCDLNQASFTWKSDPQAVKYGVRCINVESNEIVVNEKDTLSVDTTQKVFAVQPGVTYECGVASFKADNTALPIGNDKIKVATTIR